VEQNRKAGQNPTRVVASIDGGGGGGGGGGGEPQLTAFKQGNMVL